MTVRLENKNDDKLLFVRKVKNRPVPKIVFEPNKKKIWRSRKSALITVPHIKHINKGKYLYLFWPGLTRVFKETNWTKTLKPYHVCNLQMQNIKWK